MVRAQAERVILVESTDIRGTKPTGQQVMELKRRFCGIPELAH